MSITPPSFSCLKDSKPRIYILEVRDRHKPDGDPIAWLFVEREEKYEHNENGELLHATITLYYETILEKKGFSKGGHFLGTYVFIRNSGGKKASATNTEIKHGGVFVDPPELCGHRVGTYFQNEIIKWLQQWPDAEVHPIELLKESTLESDRRNSFWENFGFEFDYYDNEKRTGKSRPTSPKKLKNLDASWKKNILEHLDVTDFVGKMFCGNQRLRLKNEALERHNKALSEELHKAR
jgi:hypothetical protein